MLDYRAATLSYFKVHLQPQSLWIIPYCSCKLTLSYFKAKDAASAFRELDGASNASPSSWVELPFPIASH